MGAQNIIEIGFDVEQLTAEKKQVLDLLTDLFQQLEKYDGTKFNPLGNGGIADLKKSMQEGAAALQEFQEKVTNYNKVVTDQYQKGQQAAKEYGNTATQTAQTTVKAGAEMSVAYAGQEGSLRDNIELLVKYKSALAVNQEAQKQFKKELDSGAISTEEYNQKMVNATQRQLELKTSIADVNKELKSYSEIDTSIPNSIADAKAQNKVLTRQRDNTDVNDTAEIQRLNALIDKNNALIDANTDKLTKQKNNVGNYSGALKILEKSLNDINNKIDDYTKSGQQDTEAFKALIKEQQILQSLLSNQATGFSTATAEIRENTKALQIMANEGLAGTDAYNKLFKATAELKDQTSDLKTALKNAAPDDVAFNAAADAARGLIGIYGLAKSGAAAFGITNEALEETLVKLQAAETALQSIEAIRALFKQENAVLQLRTIALQKIQTAQTYLESAAESQNVIVKYAAVAAQKALNAVMSVAGGPMLAIIGLLGLLIVSLSSFSSASEAAARDFEQLNEEFKGFEQLLNDRITLIKQAGDVTVAEMESQFADEAKIRDARRKAMVDESSELKKFLVENAAAYREAFNITESLTQSQRAGEKLSETEQKKLDAAIKFVDQYTAVRKRSDDVEIQLEVNKLNNRKATTEEEIKARQNEIETQRVYLQNKASILNNIVGDERKAYDERRTALRQFQATQSEIIAADLSKQLLAPGLSPSQISLIKAQSKAAQDDLSRTIQKQREELNRQEADREFNAQVAIRKNQLEADAAAQDAISQDEQKQLEERLTALKKNIDDRTKVIEDDYNNRVRQAEESGKTETEITAIYSEKAKAIVDLTADTQKQIYDITVNYGEKRIKAIQDINKTINSSNQVSVDYNRENDQLSQALIDRTISYSRFLTQKKLLDQKYAIDKDKADIKDDEESLQRLRDYLYKELNLKIFFAEKELGRAKKGGDDKEIADAQAKVNGLLDIQRKAKAEEVALEEKTQKDKSKLTADQSKSTEEVDALLADRKKQIAVQSYELAKTLVNASFENRINKIQEEIDLNDKKANAEIDAVQRSTLSQQDKEAEIIIIEANQRARDTQLRNEQKQEKIKEAKFDRDVSLAQVAWNTAKAVMKDTAGVPWPVSLAVAAADITLGAIQAATILARPIPTYGDGIGIPGKGKHPGGPALTGERFEPELVTIPGQKPFIVDKPTLLDMPVGSSVLPLKAQDIVHDLGWTGLMQGAAMINSRAESPSRVVEAINNQTIQMKRAYANSQRKIQNTVNVYIDADWNNYVNKKIIGKA